MCAGDDKGGKESDEDAAFDVSTIKGRLAKRAAAGAKRGKKVVEEKKKKDEPKKPKQKVCLAPETSALTFHHVGSSDMGCSLVRKQSILMS